MQHGQHELDTESNMEADNMGGSLAKVPASIIVIGNQTRLGHPKYIVHIYRILDPLKHVSCTCAG